MAVYCEVYVRRTSSHLINSVRSLHMIAPDFFDPSLTDAL